MPRPFKSACKTTLVATHQKRTRFHKHSELGRKAPGFRARNPPEQPAACTGVASTGIVSIDDGVPIISKDFSRSPEDIVKRVLPCSIASRESPLLAAQSLVHPLLFLFFRKWITVCFCYVFASPFCPFKFHFRSSFFSPIFVTAYFVALFVIPFPVGLL